MKESGMVNKQGDKLKTKFTFLCFCFCMTDSDCPPPRLYLQASRTGRPVRAQGVTALHVAFFGGWEFRGAGGGSILADVGCLDQRDVHDMYMSAERRKRFPHLLLLPRFTKRKVMEAHNRSRARKAPCV